jgi:hypothetical protein
MFLSLTRYKLNNLGHSDWDPEAANSFAGTARLEKDMKAELSGP